MAFGLLGFLFGILMIVFGGFMIGLFPAYSSSKEAPGHQPADFTISAIFIGLVCLFVGVLLILF